MYFLYAATSSILVEPMKDVKEALFEPETMLAPQGSGPRLWTSEHYRIILRLIATSKHHAVEKRDAWKALEKESKKRKVAPAQALLSMAEFGLITLRPYSDLAIDIPRDAFGPNDISDVELDDVVTLASPAHLRAAVILFENKELERRKKKRKRRN